MSKRFNSMAVLAFDVRHENEGEATDAELLSALMQRIAGIIEHGETQAAMGDLEDQMDDEDKAGNIGAWFRHRRIYTAADWDETATYLGLYPDDMRNDEVRELLVYRWDYEEPGGYFIMKLAGGGYWTILAATEVYGTLRECEAALAKYARFEGYPGKDFQKEC